MGPKRFHQAPISINELPAIDKVLISHNHYDHLDKASVKTLAAKTKAFLVPLGVGEDLKSWGIKSEQIKEFNWWQEEETLRPRDHRGSLTLSHTGRRRGG